VRGTPEIRRPALRTVRQRNNVSPQLQAPPRPQPQLATDNVQSAGKMLLLDYQNVLIQSVLTERFSGCVTCKEPTY